LDWSRAKTILIVTFLILDLFLAAQLSQTMQQKSAPMERTVSREQIEQLLKENRIQLAIKRNTDFPLSIVAYQASITPMGPEWKKDELGGYFRVLQTPLTFKNLKDLEEILAGMVPRFEEYRLSRSSGSRIIYTQEADGRKIFDATLEVRLRGGNRIESVRIVHYNLTRLKPVKLIPFDTALYRLLTSWELKKGSSITGIELGYRAKAGAGEGYILVPYWRFQVENLKQDLFLNAQGFTKEVEVEPWDTQNESKGTK
jgi:regulatory protein YycI of two-component signal transduction system YycFG